MFYNSWNPKLTTNSCCLCARRFVWGARMCAWALSLWAHVDPRDGRQKPQAVTAPFASASEPKRRLRGCGPAHVSSRTRTFCFQFWVACRAPRALLCSALSPLYCVQSTSFYRSPFLISLNIHFASDSSLSEFHYNCAHYYAFVL